MHDEAEHVEATDWPQILALYELLERMAPNPVVTLNRTVAVAMVHGPAAGLDLLATLASDSRMANHHRLLATRAHLLELAGRPAAAAETYRAAARRATSLPERRHLTDRATRLTAAGPHSTRQPCSKPGNGSSGPGQGAVADQRAVGERDGDRGGEQPVDEVR